MQCITSYQRVVSQIKVKAEAVDGKSVFTKGILREEEAFSEMFKVNVNKYMYFGFLIFDCKEK